MFTGTRNTDTDIKECAFWRLPASAVAPIESHFRRRLGHGAAGGRDVRLVLACSDDGYVYAWSGDTGRLLGRLQCDEDIVNCVQPHPSFPVLATAGIENTIRIWAPGAPGGPRSAAGESEEALEAAALDNITDIKGANHLPSHALPPEVVQSLMAVAALQGDDAPAPCRQQ
jgi:WD40 repeat protein